MNKYIALFNEDNRRKLVSFLFYLIKRVNRENITVVAGHLSYVTLMSLVPLIIVMFSILTVFPVFTDLILKVEAFVYSQFVPAASDVIKQHLAGFVDNASKMPALAIFSLFIVALLLISTIDKSVNKIWRVTQKRRFITSFSMYWMILTFGPILVGLSIVVSSYLLSFAGNLGFVDDVNLFLFWLPLLSSTAAFFIIYTAVPNTKVPMKNAILGAFLAAICFEVAKKGFALYIIQVPSYQTIYGALSTIPILFLWVYLSWLIVLSGAVFTASLQSYKQLVKAQAIADVTTKI